MLKLFVLVSVCFLAIQFVNGQTPDTTGNMSPQALYETYMQKSKSRKTVGWVMFGSGMAMALPGFYISLLHELESDTRGETKVGPVLFYVGAATALFSIPFFISARQYKRQAKLALNGESLTIGGKKLHNADYTALTLTISLSRYKKIQ